MIATYGAQMLAAIRMSFADRTNFLLQAAGMAVNDVFFLLLWFMFFAGFRSVGGWGLADVALLLGLIMTIVGVAGIAFGGYRDMAAAILRGEVDTLLTQPQRVLPRLLARESIASAWGDFICGPALIALAGGVRWPDAPLIAICVAVGTVVYVGASVAFASLAFWFAGARSFARDLTDFMLLFSSYPGSIFQGASKVIAYTLLPAEFVVLAPVRFLRTPSAETLAIIVGGALIYAVVAVIAFYVGLARYRRGFAPGPG
jgi:ABC-2 type transport system permease protein